MCETRRQTIKPVRLENQIPRLFAPEPNLPAGVPNLFGENLYAADDPGSP